MFPNDLGSALAPYYSISTIAHCGSSTHRQLPIVNRVSVVGVRVVWLKRLTKRK